MWKVPFGPGSSEQWVLEVEVGTGRSLGRPEPACGIHRPSIRGPGYSAVTVCGSCGGGGAGHNRRVGRLGR